jgi:hypothetical protein
MARWREVRRASFEDLPKRLALREGESPEQTAARWRWLEERGLSVVVS